MAAKPEKAPRCDGTSFPFAVSDAFFVEGKALDRKTLKEINRRGTRILRRVQRYRGRKRLRVRRDPLACPRFSGHSPRPAPLSAKRNGSWASLRNP